jgi:hypothetical protein
LRTKVTALSSAHSKEPASRPRDSACPTLSPVRVCRVLKTGKVVTLHETIPLDVSAIELWMSEEDSELDEKSIKLRKDGAMMAIMEDMARK